MLKTATFEQTVANVIRGNGTIQCPNCNGVGYRETKPYALQQDRGFRRKWSYDGTCDICEEMGRLPPYKE